MFLSSVATSKVLQNSLLPTHAPINNTNRSHWVNKAKTMKLIKEVVWNRSNQSIGMGAIREERK